MLVPAQQDLVQPQPVGQQLAELVLAQEYLVAGHQI